jgi:hypothetical protein
MTANGWPDAEPRAMPNGQPLAYLNGGTFDGGGTVSAAGLPIGAWLYVALAIDTGSAPVTVNLVWSYLGGAGVQPQTTVTHPGDGTVLLVPNWGHVLESVTINGTPGNPVTYAVGGSNVPLARSSTPVVGSGGHFGVCWSEPGETVVSVPSGAAPVTQVTYDHFGADGSGAVTSYTPAGVLTGVRINQSGLWLVHCAAKVFQTAGAGAITNDELWSAAAEDASNSGASVIGGSFSLSNTAFTRNDAVAAVASPTQWNDYRLSMMTVVTVDEFASDGAIWVVQNRANVRSFELRIRYMVVTQIGIVPAGGILT